MPSTSIRSGSARKLTALITVRLEPVTLELLDERIMRLRQRTGELAGIPISVARATVIREALKLFLCLHTVT